MSQVNKISKTTMRNSQIATVIDAKRATFLYLQMSKVVSHSLVLIWKNYFSCPIWGNNNPSFVYSRFWQRKLRQLSVTSLSILSLNSSRCKSLWLEKKKIQQIPKYYVYANCLREYICNRRVRWLPLLLLF